MAAPALATSIPLVRRAAGPIVYGRSVTAPRTARTTSTCQSPLYESVFFGADRVIPTTPDTIAAMATSSRRPTCSRSMRTPRKRSRTSPSDRVGCTSVMGASERATSWNGHPRAARPVAAAQRGRRSRRESIDRRIPPSGSMSRASSAWKAMAPSKQAAAASAAASPTRSSAWIIGTILA